MRFTVLKNVSITKDHCDRFKLSSLCRLLLILILSVFSISFAKSQTITTCGAGPANCACPGAYKTVASTSVSANVATLTPGANQNGALWQCDCLDVNSSFNLSFKVNLGSNSTTGDGIAFVIQDETDSPQIIGGKGGGMGYAIGDGNNCSSSPCPIDKSIAVEFDTYNNGSITDDPDGMMDHIAIYKNGIQDATNRLLAATEISSAVSVKDGLDHYVQISWDVTTTVLKVYFDGVLKATLDDDIRNYLTSPYTCAKWGFTASNGPVAQAQKVSSVCPNVTRPTISASGALSFCSGGSVTLTASAASSYLWSNGETTQSITVSNAGTFAVIATDASGCSPTSEPVTTTIGGPNISQIPVTANISHYKLDGNAVDDVNNNNGTLQGAPSVVADRFSVSNKAYTLNGTSQYISTSKAYLNPSNFSVSLWFKTTTTSGGDLINFGNLKTGLSTTYDRNLYMSSGGQLFFGVFNGSAQTISSTNAYNDGQWHMATATLSSTNGIKLYVDGSLVASNAAVTTAQNFVGYWRVGFDNLFGWPSAPTSNYFNGTIDEVLIYYTELSSTNISTIFNSPYGTTSNSPVCQGSTINLTGPTASGATFAWSGPGSYTSASQSPSISNSTSANAGDYSVTVTSGGCSAVGYAHVVINPATITAGGATTFWCGGSVVLNANTGTGLTYQWKEAGTNIPSATNATYTASTSGNYTVAVTYPSGCTAISSATTVTVEQVTSDFTTSSSTLAINENVTITYTGNAATNANYTWNFDGGTIVSGSGQGPYVVAWSTLGTKNVTLSVIDNGCTSPMTTIPVTVLNTYYWNGNVSSSWTNSLNWSPNGVPGVNDYVFVSTAVNVPLYDGISPVTNLKITSGSLNLNNFTLSISGLADFTGGNITNGTMLLLNCDEAKFSGTTFDAIIDATCDNIYLDGSVFNETVSIEKTGNILNTCSGGNSFNAVTILTNSGSGNFVLSGTNPDDHNAAVTFINSGSGDLSPAYNGATFAGNITIDSPSDITFASGAGTVVLDGSNALTINSLNAVSFFNRLTVNKSANDVTLASSIQIGAALTLTQGKIISTQANLLVLNDGISIAGVNDDSYVEGPVRKIGNDAFTFPVGKNGFYRPATISTPANSTDHFTVEYFASSSNPIYAHTSKDALIDHLSNCEYWIIDRTNGVSSVNVTLSWASNSCGVTIPSNLIVCRYDGASWVNHGNGGYAGTTANGTVTSFSPITDFSPFTLGSTTIDNPLPISLLFFNIKEQNGKVDISWASSTADILYYEVQKTRDGELYEIVKKVDVEEIQNNKIFKAIDDQPFSGQSYYRLKEAKNNGSYDFSNLIPLHLDLHENEYTLYPNPFKNSFTIQSARGFKDKVTARLSGIDGKEIYYKQFFINDNLSTLEINMENELSGVYVLEIITTETVLRKLVIKM